MEELELSSNFTELLNLSGDCGTPLSSEAVETINYYRYLLCQNITLTMRNCLLFSIDKVAS